MKKPNLRRARAAARALRLRYSMNVAPIDVHEIARREGVRVEKGDFGSDVAAILVRDGERVIIGVNALHVRTRQRFSVAHELGHHLLHDGGRELFVDKEYLVKFRDENSGTGAEPEEVEANQFAAELIMPEELVRTAFLKVPLDIDDETWLRELARKFDVSPMAMTVRLSALGLTVGG